MNTEQSTRSQPGHGGHPPVDEVLRHLVTPLRVPAMEDEQTLMARASTATVTYRSERLNVLQWGHTGPRVLLVHGWNSRASHMGGFVEPLLAAGYQVLAFDGPGHGDSTGSRSNVVDLGQALLKVVEAIGPVDAAVGHSMGSPALLYAFARGLKVSASIHMAGPSSLIRVLQQTAAMVGIADQAQQLISLMEAETGMPVAEMELDNLAHGFCHPSLIIHDQDDREMPFQESLLLAEAWPGSELYAVSGLGHRRIIRDRTVIQRSVMMLAQHLPVGAAVTQKSVS